MRDFITSATLGIGFIDAAAAADVLLEPQDGNGIETGHC